MRASKPLENEKESYKIEVYAKKSMEGNTPRPVTLELIKGFWPVVVILFGLGMTWANLNGKIDTVIEAQKETNEVAKTLTVIVNAHENNLAILNTKMDACYSYCVAPKPLSQGETVHTIALVDQKKDPVTSSPAPQSVNVKSESKSSSEEKKTSEEPKSEPKPTPEEDDTIEIKIPKIKLPEIKLPRL